MVTHAPRREEFDPGRNFIVTRFPAGTKTLRVSGTEFPLGAPFQKNLVSTRRLRQLYDSRYVGMTEDHQPPLFQKPDFAALPDEAIREWLRSHGVVPRINATTVSLIKRADTEWEDRFGALKAIAGQRRRHR